MILVTTGTNAPAFDRLLEAVEQLEGTESHRRAARPVDAPADWGDLRGLRVV